MGVDSRGYFTIPVEHKLSAEKLLALSVQAVKVCGSDTLWVYQNVSDDGREVKCHHHALEEIQPYVSEYDDDKEYHGKRVYLQDGDPVYFEDDVQAIEIHFWGRYYHPSYARGHWPSIREVYQFLKRVLDSWDIEGARFYYGGDSSGAVAEEVTDEWLQMINDFYYGSAKDSYGQVFGRGRPTELCPTCNVQMNHHGGGGVHSYKYYACRGCGLKLVTSPVLGRLYDAHHHGDFFDLGAKLKARYDDELTQNEEKKEG